MPMTKEELKDKLSKLDSWVERAMVVLYQRQTTQEQTANVTLTENNRGFSSSDASLGSYYGRWVKDGQRLTGTHLERARLMSYKYTRQLLEAAATKEAKKLKEDKLSIEYDDEYAAERKAS